MEDEKNRALSSENEERKSSKLNIESRSADHDFRGTEGSDPDLQASGTQSSDVQATETAAAGSGSADTGAEAVGSTPPRAAGSAPAGSRAAGPASARGGNIKDTATGTTLRDAAGSAPAGSRAAGSVPAGHGDKEDTAAGTGSGSASAPELENTLSRVRPDAKKKAGKSRAASYQDKIRQHKRRRYRRNVALVVLATLLLTAAVILWMCRGYTRAELRRIAVLTAEDSSDYANLGGNVVQYGTSGALCIDQRGNTVWNVSYEMQQPVVSISGNVIAIADRNGYDIYVMDQKGLKCTIRTSLPIHNIAAGENGAVAAIMNDSKTTWVRLYSAEGREIAYIIRSMNENGYPIAAAVSPDGETMCLSSVQMSNATIKGNVSFYNFGKAGQKAADHIVQHSDYIDEVIPCLHYIDSTTCVCISDTKLYCCWMNLLRSQGSSSVPLPENVQGVFTSESFVGILYADTKGDTQYRMDLYNKRGKKAGSVGFSIPYTNISISGDKVYINNDQQCQIYTIGGRCLYDGTFGRTIRALIPGASLSDLLVVTAEEVDNVRLH